MLVGSMGGQLDDVDERGLERFAHVAPSVEGPIGAAVPYQIT
jgi:hypothetical protein